MKDLAFKTGIIISGLLVNMLAIAQDKQIVLKQIGSETQGQINSKKLNRYFTLTTVLPGTSSGNTDVIRSTDGQIKTKKEVQYFDNKCIVINTVSETTYGLLWDIEITGEEGIWSVPIETTLKWNKPDSIDFWTTWPDNQPMQKIDTWQDPFLSAPLNNRKLIYGGIDHYSRSAFVIPIASCFFKKADIGISFTQSLSDTILDLEMSTDANGRISYIHKNHRIAKNKTIRITHHIVFHQADWRAGMGWMFENFKDFFLPKNNFVNEVAGCGAYSSYEGELDIEKYKKMAFSVNWKASLDFPYMGMFIPPVASDDEEWEKYRQGGVKIGDGLASVTKLANYSKLFKEMGFHTLSYFNVTEFGNKIVYPHKRVSEKDENLWKDANDFLYSKLTTGMLRPAEITPRWNNWPIYSNWEGCVAMDPGDSTYQVFMLNQAKLHIDKIPASSGICIDRLDWLRYYNGGADDGVSLYNGNRVRSLILSWNDIMNKLGPLMHGNNKVILCNPLYRRIDLMRQIDGIYDEYGNKPTSLNLCAQLAMHKPIIAWTVKKEDFQPDPDSYFQHHLYMGAFLTVPFQGNDHTIRPDPDIEKYYLDYGSLLQAIKGRQWVLIPHVIEVENNLAKANVFRVNESIVIPVINGADNLNVKLLLRLPYNLLAKDKIVVNVLYPGTVKWKKVATKKYSETLELSVPLQRGCVLVSLK